MNRSPLYRPSIILWAASRRILSSRTALPRLYACGETCCNGVHGRNQLASNSLLESFGLCAARGRRSILYGEPPASVFTGDKPNWPHTVNRNRCLPRIGRRF